MCSTKNIVYVPFIVYHMLYIPSQGTLHLPSFKKALSPLLEGIDGSDGSLTVPGAGIGCKSDEIEFPEPSEDDFFFDCSKAPGSGDLRGLLNIVLIIYIYMYIHMYMYIYIYIPYTFSCTYIYIHIFIYTSVADQKFNSNCHNGDT